MHFFILILCLIITAITILVAYQYQRIISLNNRYRVPYYLTWFFGLFLILMRFYHLSILYDNPTMYLIILYGSTIYGAILCAFGIYLIGTILYGKYRKGESRFVSHRFLIFVLSITIIITVFGIQSARRIAVTNYTLTIEKKNNLENLHIVYLSDLHLGTTMMQESQLRDLVEMVNRQSPDIVVLGGDIFDENTPEFLYPVFIKTFKEIKAHDGVYYIYGNHEFYNDDLTQYTSALTKANITILADEALEVNKQYTIIGRIDERKNKNRKSLAQLLNEVDQSKPVFLLDHQPIVDTSGTVDLQLSGHTHNGQLFPNNYIIRLIEKYAYGFFPDAYYPLITSSGVGGWGVPMRLDTKSELVNIYVRFQ